MATDKLLSDLAKGTWSGATAYTVGDIVDNNGSSYICIANSTNNEPPNATYWALLASKGATGSQGTAGEEIELQVADGYIQWKHTSDVSWTNLIATTTLKGETGETGDTGATGADGTEIELQVTDTHIQWRYVDGSWTNLIALSELVGPTGDQGPQGDPGTSFTWLGIWSGVTAYAVNDVVYSAGNSYICIEAHTNHEPPNVTYWELLAQRGVDGEGAGDVVGPASAVNSRVAAFDGTTGKLLKDGGKTIAEIEASSIPATYLDTDTTLAANSDAKVPTQKAAKTYIDNLIAAANAMVYKGVIDCSANPNYPAADAGHAYVVSVAGKIGGASGINVEVGDILLCNTDSTSSGDQATVGTSWNIIQKNLDGAVIGPSSAVDSQIASYDGTTGKIIKDSGKAFDTDTALTANSDLKIATQKAVKAYVDNVVAAISSITLTSTPTDDTASGIKLTFTAGENLAQNDICYIKSDGKAMRADASTITTSSAIIMALGSISADASGTFLLHGIMRDDSSFNWTIGGLIYLSETLGEMTQTAPTTSNSVIQVLGVALSADAMYFHPQLVQVEHI